MRPIRLAAVAAVLAVLATACSSGQPAANRSPQGVPVSPSSRIAVPAPTLTVTPGGSGTPTSTTVDPCQLVTPPEASALTGASYGPGRLEVQSGSSRRCIYGYQTRHVFEVIVVHAASPEQAKAYAGTIRAEARQQLGTQVTLTKVTGVGDDAESLRGGGSGIDISGVYVLQGVYGIGLVDAATGRAAGTAALIAQARTVLGRLP